MPSEPKIPTPFPVRSPAAERSSWASGDSVVAKPSSDISGDEVPTSW